LFPRSSALDETERWVVATEAPVEPPVRLTFTLPVINSARDVCFVVTGTEKAGALKRVLTEPTDVKACPASGVRPAGGQLIWWVDREAASLIDPTAVRDFEFDVRDA
jgi:6-phosphogluconolactonase